MVGADETTKLWWPPICKDVFALIAVHNIFTTSKVDRKKFSKKKEKKPMRGCIQIYFIFQWNHIASQPGRSVGT